VIPARSLTRYRILAVLVAGALTFSLTSTPTGADAAEHSSSSLAAGEASAASPLLVVDVEALPIEHQLTLASLQGIVNRDRPVLYLLGLRSAQDFSLDPSAEVWLRDTVPLAVEHIGPDDAFRRLLGRTNGLVVWDPDPRIVAESQDVATTIAGLEDLVPVDPELAQHLNADRLTVLRH
jgi:hypothetical protein